MSACFGRVDVCVCVLVSGVNGYMFWWGGCVCVGGCGGRVYVGWCGGWVGDVCDEMILLIMVSISQYPSAFL